MSADHTGVDVTHDDDPRENPWVPREKLPVRRSTAPTQRTVPKPQKELAVTSINEAAPLWNAANRQQVDSLPAYRRLPVWTGPVHPHLGGRSDDVPGAGWWWLGVHGGSGVSTLAYFLPGGAQAHRWWPDPAFGGPPAVVLVCRTHLHGLQRARDAAAQWAAGDVPDHLLLAGVVTVADAPGKLHRPQSEGLRLLEAVAPRLWTVPWLDDLRFLPADGALPQPPALLRLGRDLAALRDLTGSDHR
jgi:hypothetical protein